MQKLETNSWLKLLALKNSRRLFKFSISFDLFTTKLSLTKTILSPPYYYCSTYPSVLRWPSDYLVLCHAYNMGFFSNILKTIYFSCLVFSEFLIAYHVFCQSLPQGWCNSLRWCSSWRCLILFYSLRSIYSQSIIHLPSLTVKFQGEKEGTPWSKIRRQNSFIEAIIAKLTV